MVDLVHWLGPLDGDNPSGEDLRNDPRFHDIERLLQTQVKVAYDENNKPVSEIATPIDWAAVLAKAEELRQTGRDLRLLVLVTRTLANEEGLGGLAQGLTLIAQTFDAHWDTMHPALRGNAGTREAALRRLNALADLQNGDSGLLADLRGTVFFTQAGFGPITGRDLERGTLDERVMLQEAASGLGDKEKAALVEAHAQLIARVRTACAAHADQAGDEMIALSDDARAAIAALSAVDIALNARISDATTAAPELKRFLERLLATLERANAKQAAASTAPAPAEAAVPQEKAPIMNGHFPEPGPKPAFGTGLPASISSRDEVVKCLDLVVDFYDRTEPSSPIPHLARRVRRMVHMDFVQLMEDLAPSGLKEFRLLAGFAEDNKKPT